ncbi:MAG: efflux RND transporter periplasmic adaptor subunit [Planctomycetaceae bacterium]
MTSPAVTAATPAIQKSPSGKHPAVPPHRPDSEWRRSLSSGLILAGLAAVGFLGHQTHWTFQWHSSGEAHASPSAPETGAAPAGSGLKAVGAGEIEFESTEAIANAGIQTAPVQQRTMVEEIEVHGVIDYDRKLVARLSPRVSGTVWRVMKHLGDAVHAGDVVAIIEAVQIGDAKAEFLNALAVTESRTAQRQRLEGLRDVVPEKNYREAMLSEREARVRLRNAEQTLINMGIPIRQEDFLKLDDQQRADKLHFLGLPEDLQRELDPAKHTSNLVAMTAPFGGAVINRGFGLGEVVTPSDTVFELADTSRMWVLMDIRKEDAVLVECGQRVEFHADGVEEIMVAKVDWISTEVDEITRTLHVRAQIDNPVVAEQDADGNEQRKFRAHTFGTGQILVREDLNALVVPAESVQWDQERYLVFRQISDLRFEAVPVTRGIEDDGFIEIKGQISPGTQVVTQGSHVLKSHALLNKLAERATAD